MPSQINQQGQRLIVILDHFVGHVIQQLRARVQRPGQIEQAHGDQRHQPGLDALAAGDEHPDELGQGQQCEQVKRVKPCQHAQSIRRTPLPIIPLRLCVFAWDSKSPACPHRGQAQGCGQAVHTDFLGVEDGEGIDRHQARGQIPCRSIPHIPAQRISQRDGGQAHQHTEQPQRHRLHPENQRPDMQQSIIKRRMNVLRGQAYHFSQRIPRKPHRIAFIPPQRLKIQSDQTQAQPQQRDEDDNKNGGTKTRG